MSVILRFSLSRVILLTALATFVLPITASAQATGMQGDASWNEYRFRGQLTASGERYDPASLTAASHDLPFDSLVRVTRVDNGKTVVVRINDRTSPDEHIIHLSEAAGKHLGVSPDDTRMIRLELLTGEKLTVVRRPEETLRNRQEEQNRVRDDELRAERIRIQSEERTDRAAEANQARQAVRNENRAKPQQIQAAPESNTRTISEPEQKLTLQLGVFSTQRSAKDFSRDVDGGWVAPVTVKGREQFRVYYSRFSTEAEARVAQKQLKTRGHDSFLRTL